MKLSSIHKARQEAQAIEQVPALDVENLNPRSHAVKNLEMAVRRSLALEQLCVQHLERCDSDPDKAREYQPSTFGSIDKVAGSNVANPRTLIKEVFGDDYYAHPEWTQWPTLFDAWYSGSLRRQREAALRNLPAKLRKKYE